ncbi:MAG: hypothetical protein M1821_008794 [Bathelium mastoideum]|nr:MAG: hypothetical protein M1821_008794 [Bathelium mastoideum]
MERGANCDARSGVRVTVLQTGDRDSAIFVGAPLSSSLREESSIRARNLGETRAGHARRPPSAGNESAVVALETNVESLLTRHNAHISPPRHASQASVGRSMARQESSAATASLASVTIKTNYPFQFCLSYLAHQQPLSSLSTAHAASADRLPPAYYPLGGLSSALLGGLLQRAKPARTLESNSTPSQLGNSPPFALAPKKKFATTSAVQVSRIEGHG